MDAPMDTLTPEQLDAEITALQANIRGTHLDPALPEKTARLEALYKARYGTEDVEPGAPLTKAPAAALPGEESAELPVPPIPFELAATHRYDHDALAELGPAVAAAGVPLEEIRLWVNVGHSRLALGATHNPEPSAEVVITDEQIADARAVLGRLTPSTRAAVERFLEATGLHEHPPFIEWLAQHGARLKAPR